MSASDTGRWPTVRAPTLSDFTPWRDLYDGYCRFYGRIPSQADAETVWGWLQDPEHAERALLAETAAGEIVGLAHFRPFPRPGDASIGCFLDDLFVSPASRGAGVADALLAAVRREAAVRGWSVVRWITADDNFRARSKYHQVAKRTMWVTYDMEP